MFSRRWPSTRLDGGGGCDAAIAQDRLDEALSARGRFRHDAAPTRRRAQGVRRCRSRRSTPRARRRSSQACGRCSHTLCSGRRGKHQQSAGVTRAYAARFTALGGVTLTGDALLAASLRAAAGASRPTRGGSTVTSWSRSGRGRRMCSSRSAEAADRSSAGITGISVREGDAALARPVVDGERRLSITPMEQGIRSPPGRIRRAQRGADTGAIRPPHAAGAGAVSARRARRQSDRMGSRPSFTDSRPVIGAAPGLPGLWLGIGHAHWGLTLGPTPGA